MNETAGVERRTVTFPSHGVDCAAWYFCIRPVKYTLLGMRSVWWLLGSGSLLLSRGPAVWEEFIDVLGGVRADGGEEIAKVAKGIDPLAASLQAAVGA